MVKLWESFLIEMNKKQQTIKIKKEYKQGKISRREAIRKLKKLKDRIIDITLKI